MQHSGELLIGSIGSSADYVCDGANDDIEFSAAISALGVKYSKLYVLPGTYNFSANVLISKSDIEIEFAPGAVVKAAQRTDTSFKSEYRGMLTVRNAGGPQANVHIHGGTIDCNFQAETSALSIQGSGKSSGASVMTNNIVIENVIFKNKGNSSYSPALVQVHSVTDMNVGRVDNVHIKRCVFDGSDAGALTLRGSYLTNVWVHQQNEFKNIAVNTINCGDGSEAGNVVRTFKNIYILDNYFHDTMIKRVDATTYDFGMSSRRGVETLVIRGNTFDSANQYPNNDNPNLQIYASHDVTISHNTFKNTRQALSLGYSNNATVLFSDPNQAIRITDNSFIRVRHTLTDYDATARIIWSHNTFHECGLNIGEAYSVHGFSVFENNFVYNCHRLVEDDAAFSLYSRSMTPATFPDKYKSVLTIGGQNHYIVRGNTIVDSRKLNDPSSTPLADSSLVVGGTMGGRTYYFRYVFQNVSGHTKASPSRSVSVGANQLLRIRPITDAGTNYRTSNSSTAPLNVNGIEQILIYVGTTAGSETLQATIDYPDFTAQGAGWTEPSSGLVSGATLPTSNTTHALTKYEFYEDTLNGGYFGSNVFENNYFFGIPMANAIYTPSPTVSRAVRRNNTYTVDLSGSSYTD